MLHDLTSVWMEGRACPLARRGHSRDGKKGKLQSAFCVIGTGVGAGVPRQHPATLSSQITTLQERFSLAKVVLVGDRGTEAREEVKPAGLDQRLEGTGHPFTGGGRRCRDVALRRERLGGDHQRCVSRRTPLPQPIAGRGPGPRDLLEATEARTDRSSDTARQAPGRSGRGSARSSAGTRWRSTSRGPSTMTVSSPVGAMRLPSLPRPGSTVPARCARLQAAELRGTGLPQPQDRGPEGASRLPPHRAPGHVFLCMLACYIEWHMRQRLKPLLFDDEDAEGDRPSWRRQRSRRAPGPRRQPRGRPGMAQLLHPHRRSRDHHPQHRGAPPCGRQTLPSYHTAHAATEKGLGLSRRAPVAFSVATHSILSNVNTFITSNCSPPGSGLMSG